MNRIIRMAALVGAVFFGAFGLAACHDPVGGPYLTSANYIDDHCAPGEGNLSWASTSPDGHHWGWGHYEDIRDDPNLHQALWVHTKGIFQATYDDVIARHPDLVVGTWYIWSSGDYCGFPPGSGYMGT